jgi:type I restriction enzyme S subunit
VQNNQLQTDNVKGSFDISPKTDYNYISEPGLLPEEWNSCTLNQTDYFDYENGIWKGTKGELVNCNVLRNTNFRNDGTLNYSDVATIPIEKRHLNKKQLKFGDIIIERSGGGPTQPVGRVVFFERDNEIFCFSNFTSRLRVIDHKKVDPRFLHLYLFYFHSIGKTNELQQRTTGIRNLMFEDYKKSVIPLPPLPEQLAIAATLRTVQEAKEKTDAMIAATKALKAAMMKHLFTYGPVPPEEAERVVLKETEIGAVPEGWDIKSLKEVSKIYSGGTPSKDNPEFWNGEIPWASPKDLKSLILDDVIDHISEEGLAAGSRLVPANSIFIVIRGMILIRDVPVSLITRPMAFNQDMKAICPNPEIDPMYLLHAISQYRMNLSRHIGTSAHGTKRISTSAIEDFLIPVPPKKEQKIVVDMLNSIDQKLAAEQSRREALKTLFNSLLHDLMTAKIRVSSAEAT